MVQLYGVSTKGGTVQSSSFSLDLHRRTCAPLWGSPPRFTSNPLCYNISMDNFDDVFYRGFHRINLYRPRALRRLYRHHALPHRPHHLTKTDETRTEAVGGGPSLSFWVFLWNKKWRNRRDSHRSRRRRSESLFLSFLWNKKWRNRRDSNSRPLPWQGSALTNWATIPAQNILYTISAKITIPLVSTRIVWYNTSQYGY